MTYNEMRMKTVCAARNLLRRGIKPREAFGFLAEHSDNLVPIMLASICLACPMAPVYPILSTPEVIRFFLKAKPSAVFCDASACAQLAEALQELPFSVQRFTFGGTVDGFEPVENLFIDTGDDAVFV